MTFPVGYHRLHPDASMNFQMNRWFGWVGEPEMLEEMRTAAARIATYVDWKRSFWHCIEELTSAFIYLRDAGYDVIAFDGPGQGSALDDSGLPMTAEWHKPVSAILDYFEVERVALVGLSLGGCLVLRASALEPRVAYVIAYDVLTSFLDVNLRQTNALLRGLLKVALRLGAARMVNGMVARVARSSPVVRWGIQQGMHVTGTSSAFEFLRRIEQFQTADISASISQDVLLLAGSEDHYVPVEQWHHQIGMLENARSITARLFTRSECAQNHCQVGNYGLALRTIVNWLDGMLVECAKDSP